MGFGRLGATTILLTSEFQNEIETHFAKDWFSVEQMEGLQHTLCKGGNWSFELCNGKELGGPTLRFLFLFPINKSHSSEFVV